LRLLLDEMYSARLAEALRAVDVDTATVVELGLAGRSDLDVFAAGVEQDRVVLTENTADFRPISAEHLNTGQHHPGILIAVSSRFSRRPAGIGMLVSAIRAVADQQLEDRVLYLELPEQP
jgi:predicted nuclease of predicted toxin-antitoxin system